MLLFITVGQESKVNCTNISIHLMLLFIYPPGLFFHALKSFQYISCYCLSEFRNILERTMLRFQYISCYCLSHTPSFLFLQGYNFNTSHVTVYLQHLPQVLLSMLISIHLMLLFIGFNKEGIMRLCKFQYISCYCLSNV